MVRVWIAAEMLSLQFLLIFSTTVSIVTAFVYLRSKRKQKRGKFPSGYRGWPFIGEIIPFSKSVHVGTLGNFMEQRISRFGRIFSSNLLGRKIIVSADAELNRYVLQNEMRLFENYSPPHISKVAGKSSLTLQMGDAHKRTKSILVSYLTTSTIQTTWLRNSNEAAEKIFSSWESGSVHCVYLAARRYVCNIIIKSVLSIEPEEPGASNLTEYLETIAEAFTTTIPINLPGTKVNKSLKLRKMVDKTVKQITEERTSPEGKRKNDFLEWVMKTGNLSWEQTCDLIADLLVAGSVTIPQVIGLVIYFLQCCPKALEQLRKEHLQVGSHKRQDGSVDLTWENYKKMNFTQCIIDETLRLMPAMLMRKATMDIQYKGYEIPSGSIFAINFAGAHLDPSLFENPKVFNPWQWLSTSGIKKTNNFMAFGGGPRLCPGAESGRLEIAVFLHHLILNYTWRLEKVDKPISNHLVKFPNGLPIRVDALPSSF